MCLSTTACNFSSLIWPHGSAPTALARLLFDLPEPQIIGKTQCLAPFPTFSRAWIFFLLTLSLFDLLSSSLLFSDSSHLCFSSVHIVGSLTSKLLRLSIHNESTVTEIWELWISHVFQRYFSGSFGVRFWICWQRLAPKKWWRTANSACQAG